MGLRLAVESEVRGIRHLVGERAERQRGVLVDIRVRQCGCGGPLHRLDREACGLPVVENAEVGALPGRQAVEVVERPADPLGGLDTVDCLLPVGVHPDGNPGDRRDEARTELLVLQHVPGLAALAQRGACRAGDGDEQHDGDHEELPRVAEAPQACLCRPQDGGPPNARWPRSPAHRPSRRVDGTRL